MEADIALGLELEAERRARLPDRVYVGCKPTQKLTFIYAQNAGPYIFPPVAVNILSEFGSEGHVFHKVEAIIGDVSLGPYYLQLQAPVIDCVDVDETIYEDGRGREYYEEVMARPHGPGGVGPPRVPISAAQRIVLRRSTIEGRHWWRVPEAFSTDHFCSLELRRRFKEAGIAGLQYTQCFVSTKIK
ncbi:MAG: hypothetical protein GC189_10535 [Alphaproteobacteria bacterium]|nr:hypothetical protein [Alphaproteobacteria bacterium]